jgi:hypothetical protein
VKVLFPIRRFLMGFWKWLQVMLCQYYEKNNIAKLS